jgi:hypothetical protein
MRMAQFVMTLVNVCIYVEALGPWVDVHSQRLAGVTGKGCSATGGWSRLHPMVVNCCLASWRVCGFRLFKQFVIAFLGVF